MSNRRPNHDDRGSFERRRHSRILTGVHQATFGESNRRRSTHEDYPLNESLSHYLPVSPTTTSLAFGQEYSSNDPYDPDADAARTQEMLDQRKNLKFYQVFRYATCVDWALMVAGVIIAILASIITPWLYYCTGIALQDIVVFERCKPIKPPGGNCSIPHHCERSFPDVGKTFAIVIASAWALFVLAQVFYSVCFTIAADRQTKKIRKAYFESTVRKDMAWFDMFTGRDFAKSMTEEVTHIRLGIGDVIPKLINTVCTAIFLLILIFYLHYEVALSFLCVVPVSILIVYWGNMAEQKRSDLANSAFTEAHRLAKEELVNIKIIKMYQGEQVQLRRFKKALDATDTEDEAKYLTIAAISSGTVWLVLNLATAVVFSLGSGTLQHNLEFCNSTKTSERDTFFKRKFVDIVNGIHVAEGPGEMILVYLGLLYITLHTMELPNLLTLLEIAKDNATRVYFLINWKSRIDNLSTEGKLPKRYAVGRIDFDQVTFRYPKNPDEAILQIPALTIFSGQFVVFAGPALSGKSTILKLIPRLYDVCSGYIALDAVNLQNYSLRWLRQQLCKISEEPIIFTGTIFDNILFGKLTASQEDVEKACRKANIHDVIERLPKGYNTVISSKEHGDKLSRNEKRQLCLARAYLHRSRVILLDNPLRHDDDELEAQLLKFVNSVRETCTVIMASTTVNALTKRADCIYYMENGTIVEHGSHIQLIQAKGKYYTRLEETINCSLDSRKKFDSQLQAYKVNQILQKKRAYSEAFQYLEMANELQNSEPTRRPFLQSVFEKFRIGKSVRSSAEENNTGMNSIDAWNSEIVAKSQGSTDSNGDDERKLSERKPQQLQNQTRHLEQEQAIATSSLEAAYHRYSGGNRKSSERFMHHGFGLMGFQRMNFARPMTNYTTQIQKHRLAFYSKFPAVGKNPGRRSQHPSLSVDVDSHLGLDDSKGPTAKKRSPPFSNGTPEHPSKGARKGSPRPAGGVASSKPKWSPVAHPGVSKTKHASPPEVDFSGRQSYIDALKMLTQPQAAVNSLNENVEIEDLRVFSYEVDELLNEYDNTIYSTINDHVTGFWRDLLFVSKHDWVFIGPALFASVILGLSAPAQAFIIGRYFMALGTDFESYDERMSKITWKTVGMVIMGIVTGLAAFSQEFCFGMAGKRMTRHLRERLFGHLLTQDLAWFDEKCHDIGILSFQLYADVIIIHHTLLVSYGLAVQALTNFGASISVALATSPDDTFPVVITFVLLMPVLILIVFYSSKRELTEAANLDRKFDPARDFTLEFLQNIPTWATLGAEPHFIATHNKILDKEYRRITLSTILTAFIHNLVQTSGWCLYGLFIMACFSFHDHSHDSPMVQSPLLFPIVVTAEILIFGSFRIGDQLVLLADTEMGKSAAHKIMRILVNQSEVDSVSRGITTAGPRLVDDQPPEIMLNNIYYRYPNTANDEESTLDGITLRIPSGSYIAIVGPPGCGKSTLCNIILQMCEPSYGFIEFNGDDAYKMNPKITRKLMGLVDYDPCLFNFTVEQNIRFGNSSKEPSKLAVVDAAKLALCHYDILDLVKDYECEVSCIERTAQMFALKQRIAYARALVRIPKILVIDDCTSSVDTESDNKLNQVIANVREGRTLIVFSHKIEPVREAEAIYVLWDGTIVEHGSDTKLLAKQGYYYEMYMTQKVLAETMRNSPHQLSTIRYNVKTLEKRMESRPASAAPSSDIRGVPHRISMAQLPHLPQRRSSVAYLKFLNEKMQRIKAEKLIRRNELEKEVSELEKEEKEREKSRHLTQKSKPGGDTNV